MKEIFKDIAEYEGLYQVSNLGNVKALNYRHTGKDKILKPKNKKDGYLEVNLCKEGKVKHHLIHRLVGQAFIENPNNLPQINHRDEDKTNNASSNLEWCDAAYNINYSQSKQVMCLETGVVYSSTMEVERQLGFAHSNISSACNGKYKQAYGYTWQYVS